MYITNEPIDLGDFFSFTPAKSCGALATFTGIVRDHDHGRQVKKLYYDCYPSMAERMIKILVAEAKNQWGVDEIRVSHRIGSLEIGEVAVAIAVSSAHRAESFSACRFIIEEIKKRVPIWKKEIFENGASEWVLCTHPEAVTL